METSALQSYSSNQSASLSSAVSGTSNLGKEDFLKLLVAQLAHQDPLQPMENSEFVAQLAQFSSLEQLMGANQNLAILQVGQAAMTNGQVASLIGREVEAKGDVLNLSASGSAAINFDLGGAAKEVTIKITDSNGKEVRTLALGARNAGVNSYTWDGKDANGNALPAGSYKIQVSAKDASGTAVDASTRFHGIVTGITYKNGAPILEIGSATVAVGDVISIRAPGGTSTGS